MRMLIRLYHPKAHKSAWRNLLPAIAAITDEVIANCESGETYRGVGHQENMFAWFVECDSAKQNHVIERITLQRDTHAPDAKLIFVTLTVTDIKS